MREYGWKKGAWYHFMSVKVLYDYVLYQHHITCATKIQWLSAREMRYRNTKEHLWCRLVVSGENHFACSTRSHRYSNNRHQRYCAFAWSEAK